MNIIWFKDCDYHNTHLIGGKNASLGKLMKYDTNLFKNANGFAISTIFYDDFITFNNLNTKIDDILTDIDFNNLESLNEISTKLKELFHNTVFTNHQLKCLKDAYLTLKSLYPNPIQVAVRSSAIAEDLPNASFAGQQDTYLNINSFHDLKNSIVKCYASLFNSNAISYRHTNNIKKEEVKMSIGVQKMVRSDLAIAGVAFSLDPQTGYNNAITINASYGLGEGVVSGLVNPDDIIVDKRSLHQNIKDPIIGITIGNKKQKVIYASQGSGTIKVNTTEKEQDRLCITYEEIKKIGKAVLYLETYYKKLYHNNVSIDIEWAFDGIDKELYIIQVRAETVHSNKDNTKLQLENYKLLEDGQILVKGVAVGDKISCGKVVCSNDILGVSNIFKTGDILVTDMTTPDWEPVMKISSGIITNKGGKTCHASIIARELNINALVGCGNATDILKSVVGDKVTIDCSKGDKGCVLKGELMFDIERQDINLENDKYYNTAIMLNIGNPDIVFKASMLPHQGVGLTRMEFIIINYIKIHPLLLIDYDNNIKMENNIYNEVKKILNHSSGTNYFIKQLARGIGKIASAIYPYPVIVRLSDFKSNEYRNLLGGDRYEPDEENPMIGWRGASRYYSKEYERAFRLECQGISYARKEMGMKNIVVMIPFCRTPEECAKVIKIMGEEGLERGVDDLQVYIMCEIPSNVIEADRFAPLIDGVSIGGNDLLQLTLGIDRDSEMITHIGDDKNVSYRRMITQAIKSYRALGVKVGFCGQQPSDSVEFAEFLVKEGIDSISVTPDSILKLF
jgi:pyruvate, water dikinase